MRTESKHILRNLRCEENDHPYRAEILQTVFYGPDNEILFHTTPHGAIEDVAWCPVPGCGSPPKDPNA